MRLLLPELAGRLTINYSKLKIHLKEPSHMSSCCFGGKGDKNLLKDSFFFPVVIRTFNITVLVLYFVCWTSF